MLASSNDLNNTRTHMYKHSRDVDGSIILALEHDTILNVTQWSTKLYVASFK